MKTTLYPHGYFLLEFMALLEEGKRQEAIHPANRGESSIAGLMHFFFDKHVLRLIRNNEWVFEAAQIFVTDYAMDCFRYLKLGGQEVYSEWKKHQEINKRVIDLTVRLGLTGAIPNAGEISLVKASDFRDHIEFSKLSEENREEVNQVYEEAVEQEDLQIWSTLRAIRDLYEITLPRVMFVVRRVIKVMQEIKPKASDNDLSSISNYLDWYEINVDTNHPLYVVLGKLRPFYKVARNVASHHKGFSWDPSNNQVILEDEKDTVAIHVHEFQKNYRYLVYLCDFALRGILAAYCEREKGDVSDNLIKEYAKTFPEDFPQGVPGRIRFYVS